MWTIMAQQKMILFLLTIWGHHFLNEIPRGSK